MNYGIPIAGVIVACTLSAERIDAQAYCALRDPVRQIYTLFPEATNYRSIVRTIDRDDRVAVGGASSLTLHFNELGRHTLYVALKNERPIGIVHVRSERSDWGLLEAAWALDFDLRIVDFALQRCRSPHRRKIESDAFRVQLKGLNFEGIQRQLHGESSDSRSLPIESPPGAEQLTTALLRCAAKTLLVTQVVWKDDVRRLRILSRVAEAIPGTVELQPDGEAPQQDRAEQKQDGDILGDIAFLRALTADGQKVGLVALTELQFDQTRFHLWWILGADLKLRAVFPDHAWPDDSTRVALESLVGKTLDGECATRAELAASAVFKAAQHRRNE